MTVKELIEKLQEFDPNLLVKTHEGFNTYDVMDVSLRVKGGRYSEKELRWVNHGPYVLVE